MRDRSVVVMPAAHRPEFCALSLFFLGRAERCPPVLLNVDDVDLRLKNEFKYVFEKFAPPDSVLTFRKPHREASSGCWNILQSIKDGRLYDGADWIMLVEEDVFVCEEFFTEHWLTMETASATMASGGYAISCGRKCPRFWKTHPNVYTNPGACLTGDFVDLLIPHINDQFFDDTGKYIKNLNPGKPGFIGGLDDGLIRRLVDIHDLKVHHQDPAICSHVGFQAYENRYDFCRVEEGPIDKRIRNLKEMFLRLDSKSSAYGMHIRDLDPLTTAQLSDLRYSLSQ